MKPPDNLPPATLNFLRALRSAPLVQGALIRELDRREVGRRDWLKWWGFVMEFREKRGIRSTEGWKPPAPVLLMRRQ